MPHEPTPLREVQSGEESSTWRVSSANIREATSAGHTKCVLNCTLLEVLSIRRDLIERSGTSEAWHCSLRYDAEGVYPCASLEGWRTVRTKFCLVGRVGVEPTAR